MPVSDGIPRGHMGKFIVSDKIPKQLNTPEIFPSQGSTCWDETFRFNLFDCHYKSDT